MVGVLTGETTSHSLFEAAIVGVFGVGACLRRLSPTTRSALATLGLVICSAILVHFFHGLIEMHFHFFVMVAVVALYQAWQPYLLAVGFVLVQHSVVGALAPHEVYSHPSAWGQPWTWAMIHGAFILAESVTCLMYWRVSEDALDREREARVGLEQAHQDLAKAQELSGVGSWEWDVSSNLVTWSDHLYAIAGSEMEVFVPSITSFLDLVHAEDRERVGGLIAAAVKDGSRLDYECRIARPNGQIRIIHALGECLIASDGTLARLFGTVHDVTEHKALQEEIERLAFHDPLTGLGNRRLFLNRLEHALTVRRPTGLGCAVLFMDLDDFKKINDTLGHGAGDELLCAVARRLESALRTADTIARFGGDEFAVLLDDVDLARSTALAERIGTTLRRPLRIQGVDISIRGSIGIAVAEGDTSADDILRDADAAMYAVKSGGKDSHNAFPSTASLS